MAKITSIDYTLGGVARKAAVNCSANGVFNITLPEEWAQAFQIHKRIDGGSLDAVTKQFRDIEKRYKDSKVSEEIVLAVFFGVMGDFVPKGENEITLPEAKPKFRIQTSSGWENSRAKNVMGLSYMRLLVEDIDGVRTYHEAIKVKDVNHWYSDKYKDRDPESFVKGTKQSEFDIKSATFIPYTEEAEQALCNAIDKIKKVASFLLKFMNQSEEEINQMLIQQSAFFATKALPAAKGG